MHGCHTPPPPPTPWYPPLPVKWVVVLFGLVAPPLWSGACGLFGWPRPACGGQCVLQYGCCRLLVVMSSLHALSPPPLWGGACGRLGWPRPACVCSTEIWYGCCRLLAVMSSLRARYHAKYDVALLSLQAVPLSLL